MFKYQDLLYTEKVAPTWYSPFTEYAMVLLSEVSNDVNLGKIEPEKAMEFSQQFINFTMALENQVFNGNKQFIRDFMNIMERNNIPPLPVQYDISDFLDNFLKSIPGIKRIPVDDILREFKKGFELTAEQIKKVRDFFSYNSSGGSKSINYSKYEKYFKKLYNKDKNKAKKEMKQLINYLKKNTK